MLEELKAAVCEANLKLVAAGLVVETFGNVSGVDRPSGHLVIKPSGVPYEKMKPEKMVVISLQTGDVVEPGLRASMDAPTHRELYLAFEAVGGIAHTHSLYATAWAQAEQEMKPLGTSHADYFHGPVPCTRPLTPAEIESDYEANTGKVIVERFAGLDPTHLPGILVAKHGPFAWGATPAEAVHNAAILERLARLASETLRVREYPGDIDQALLDKHFLRKHGPDAAYGQK